MIYMIQVTELQMKMELGAESEERWAGGGGEVGRRRRRGGQEEEEEIKEEQIENWKMYCKCVPLPTAV